MGTRRVRTAAGQDRYNKPIGALISRTRLRDVEDITPKINGRRKASAPAARQRKEKITGDLRTAAGAIDVANLGVKLTARERDLVEYQAASVRRRSQRERGTVVKPRDEALRDVRRRNSRTGQRIVAVNPLSGRTVVQRETGRGVTRRASVERAKGRKAPRVTEYVGRRRARD